MEMIIGGAYQGKSSYAKKQFPDVKWKCGAELTGEDLSGLAEKLAEKNPGVVLVSEEVGYGIVPADAFERQYREAVGRVCTELAGKSSRVTRVVCGIGMVLKNA